MDMILIDTSVLYAWLFKADSQHLVAREIIESQKQTIHIIPEIWAEVMSLVSNRHGAQRAIDVDQALKTIADFHFYDHNIGQNDVWMTVFLSHAPHRMSIPDCTLLYLALEQSHEVLTLDREMQKYLPSSRK